MLGKMCCTVKQMDLLHGSMLMSLMCMDMLIQPGKDLQSESFFVCRAPSPWASWQR